MGVSETEVPGVGRKFDVDLGGGEGVVVVVHHDGRCELYHRDAPDADGTKLLDLSAERANKIGAILERSYYESDADDADDVAVPVGEGVIEWTAVEDDSPVAGATIGDLGVREATGVSVIAIQRGDDTLPNPGSEETLEPGDVVVTMGDAAAQDRFGRFVAEGDAG